MKILKKEASGIEFSKLDDGTAFYSEARDLYMKVRHTKWDENAVRLEDGCLCGFDKDTIVTPARVHIEDD